MLYQQLLFMETLNEPVNIVFDISECYYQFNLIYRMAKLSDNTTIETQSYLLENKYVAI
jgi:hypothetical protein